MYGCEAWTLPVTNGECLKIYERKILRKIYGPVRNTNTEEYRTHTNKELEDLYKAPNIIQSLKRDSCSGMDG